MGASASQQIVYSTPVPGSKATEKKTSARRGLYGDGQIISNFDPPCRNAWDIFQRGVSINPEGNCLGTRVILPDGSFGDYQWKTYRQVENLAICLGSALMHLNFVPPCSFKEEPKHMDLRCVAIFAQNREEWLITEAACNAFGFTIVPLYDTLGNESTRFILSQTQLECVIAGKECIHRVLLALKTPADIEEAEPPKVKHLIYLDAISEEDKKLAGELGVGLHSWDEVILVGKENCKPLNESTMPNLDNVNTICYTSGTTGLPKGVVMTQGNFVAVIASACLGPLSEEFLSIGPNDSILSYLPLAHVYERFVDNIFLSVGGSIGFYTGDTRTLLNDVQALKPTVFCSVPRLFDRINNRVFESLEEKSGLAKALFLRGLDAKLKRLRSCGCTEHMFWDKLIFSKTKSLMGGRVRFMLTGSAPLDPVVHERMKVLFCVPVLEGYGLTETMGASILTHYNDVDVGYVGGPVPGLEICLEDVSGEMEEYSIYDKIPKGELCARGPVCTLGYFRNPAANADVIDSEGWTHTGDIAAILENGAVKIIDRKKNIFKLSQGEYIASEKIERVYENSPLIQQAFVFGYSHESYLVGIFVLEEDQAMRWAKDNKKSYTTLSEMLHDEDLISLVQSQGEKAAKEANLKGFEFVKKFALYDAPFTVENEILTPTFKLRRHKAKQIFSKTIDELYGKKGN